MSLGALGSLLGLALIAGAVAGWRQVEAARAEEWTHTLRTSQAIWLCGGPEDARNRARAEAGFEQCAHRRPDRAEPWLRLAEIRLAAGDPQTADQHLDRAAALGCEGFAWNRLRRHAALARFGEVPEWLEPLPVKGDWREWSEIDRHAYADELLERGQDLALAYEVAGSLSDGTAVELPIVPGLLRAAVLQRSAFSAEPCVLGDRTLEAQAALDEYGACLERNPECRGARAGRDGLLRTAREHGLAIGGACPSSGPCRKSGRCRDAGSCPAAGPPPGAEPES